MLINVTMHYCLIKEKKEKKKTLKYGIKEKKMCVNNKDKYGIY